MLVDRPLTATSRRQATSQRRGQGSQKKVARDRWSGAHNLVVSACPVPTYFA